MRSHSGDFKLQLDLEIAQSDVPAKVQLPELNQPGRRCIETSRNVISFAFIEKQRPLSRFYFDPFFGVYQPSHPVLEWRLEACGMPEFHDLDDTFFLSLVVEKIRGAARNREFVRRRARRTRHPSMPRPGQHGHAAPRNRSQHPVRPKI